MRKISTILVAKYGYTDKLEIARWLQCLINQGFQFWVSCRDGNGMQTITSQYHVMSKAIRFCSLQLL